MSELIKKMKENYIFAVIRGKDEEDAFKIAKAAIKGGIKNIELTFSTPNVEKVIERIAEDYKTDETVVVGAGTVMTVDLAKKAVESGSKFLVSPHFSTEIADFANENDIYYMPGCGTVTEIVSAMKVGCEIIKIFPGGILGSGFIKDVHGPIPEAQLMPSGGVSINNIKEWRDNGAVAVGVGSALSKNVETEGYESVTEVAEKFIHTLRG